MAYAMGGSQPVIVLKEGTERSKNREAQSNNIAAAKAVADSVRSTLGPKGMDKMLVDSVGDIVITNDGVTILKEIDVQHPAAKMVVEVAKTQDTECGDGTTTAVILAGELLKKAESLIESNVHPTIIANGYKMAAAEAVKILENMAFDVTKKQSEILKKVAITAMTGKSVGGHREYLADMAVQAVISVAEERDGKYLVDVDNIKVEKRMGASIAETEVIKGLVIDKERVHPRMPKKIEGAKIVLLKPAMEIKKTEIDAKISIKDPESMARFLDEEESTLKKMVESVKAAGANVVFCQKGIDDLVQHYMAKEGIYAIRRIKASDMEKLAKATGAKFVGSIDEISKDDLGYAEFVEQRKVGEEGMTFITGCENPKAVTGGGSVEIELSLRLDNYAASIGGREQLAIEAFAEAMESIPWVLAENAGLDAIDVVIKLKSAHEKKNKNAKVMGVNLANGEPINMLDENVIEPLRCKTQAVKAATEVANMILRIDDVIASRSAPPMPPGGGGMPGMGMGGMPGMM
ncbi:MAG TPA: thermosome subunit beta [Methanomassiliicoccales archaeon]|nr:thermosome subunit beta [Methanomassiliicoccales archaeon]